MKRQTVIDYFSFIILTIAVMVVVALFSALQCYFDINNTLHVSNDVSCDNITIVIDPGHGGLDGGAVGINGSVEKVLNLAISEYLYDLFALTDIDVVMTRKEDILLYNENQSSRKKFFDLKNRMEFCNSYEKPIFISIHQNKFPVEKYKGLQVYYSGNNDESKNLAKNIQINTHRYLQNDNNRNIKEAGRNIFLLDRLDCPAVLIECGFLSNSYEEKMLSDKNYQRKLAFIFFSSIIEYLQKTEQGFKNEV